MVAAGLTGVYAEPWPNFEVLTLVVFLSGILLGARGGAWVGGLTMLAYSLLNPYGPAHPVVTLSQVVGELVAGPAGAAFLAAGFVSRPVAIRASILAVAAILLTAFFDFITNLASGIIYGQIRIMLIGGIPFSLIHIGTNVLLFVVLGTPLCGLFARYRERLSA
ncbi:MAG TPA: hypothetical protein VL123_09205 [Candidatus Udaeobacter sp.]|jgi:hypothetical protein|nr:hypothetical protein [Candidatus Udaeobacter sp.]